MYIKLGSIKANYSNTGSSDFMIISEIVDSSLSYHKPVLVKSVEELDIWFGKNFSSREFLVHLLELGVTLYLTKPLSTEIDTTSLEDYIDLRKYNDNLDANKNFIINNTLEEIENPQENIKYRVVDLDGIYKDNKVPYKVVIYKYNENNDDGEFIYVDDLPQNINSNENTLSNLNRDTLAIFSKNLYCSPKYTEDVFSDIIFKKPEFYDPDGNPIPLDIDITGLNCSRLYNNLQTLAFDLIVDEDIDLNYNLSIKNYIRFSPVVGSKDILFIKESSPGTYPDGLTNGCEVIFVDTLYDIENKLLTDVYNWKRYRSYVSGNKKIITYILPQIYDVNYWYNLGDKISLVPNISLSMELLYNELIEESSSENTTTTTLIPDDSTTTTTTTLTPMPLMVLSVDTEQDQGIIEELPKDPIISLVSKTIGTSLDDEGKIRISIEDLGDNIYTITLTRYDYREIYTGTISNSIGTNRLDNIINKYSKLVNCYFSKNITSLPEIKDIPLVGGYDEGKSIGMYKKALSSLFNPPEPIYIDYFLVPDIKEYKEYNKDYDYYLIYKDFLQYANELNFQVLIQNSDNWSKYESIFDLSEIVEENVLYCIEAEGIYFELKNNEIVELNYSDDKKDKLVINDYKYNYREDEDNRLIYFFRSMKVGDYEMPGYYIYLTNLLLNDKYSPSVSNIFYNTPVQNPYEDTLSDLEVDLEKHKSNYLVSNNYIYYQKKYLNGSRFNTTGWMRFCLGKISRELMKHKWSIIGDKRIKSVEDKLNAIFSNIKNSFSMIRDIRLINCRASIEKQFLEITIDTYMSDLVDNHIRLDITLNFNKS